MLPNPTEINPILELFLPIKIPLSLIFIIGVIPFIFGFMVIFLDVMDLKKWKKRFWTAFLFVVAIIVSYFIVFFSIDTFDKNINKTPLKTVFSSYRIVEIKQPKESDSNITYDVSGNITSEKPRTLFNVYLEQTKGVKTMELEHNVVLKVSKVNEDSFEIILPDEKVEKIKKDDAQEVFNTLKKIEDNEKWIEVQKMIRDRRVEKEE